MEKKLRSLFIIALGNMLLTSAYTLFAVPNNIVDGGVTSTALLLSHYFNMNITYIICCITCLILGFTYLAMGTRFFLKTLFSSICYISFFIFFRWAGVSIDTTVLNSIIIAGILVGTGHYLCLKENSATIGYDVIALFCHKINSRCSTTCILWIICSSILLLGASFFGVKVVLMGILFVFIETQVIYWCSDRGKDF